MSGNSSFQCEQVFELLTSPEGGEFQMESVEHIASCPHCQELVKHCSSAVSLVRDVASSMPQPSSPAIEGPWQVESQKGKVAAPVTAASVKVRSMDRNAMAHWAWLTALAAVILLMVGWQGWNRNDDSVSAAPLTRQTLAWSPVSDGQPSAAGLAFLTSLQLPQSCSTTTQQDEEQEDSDSDFTPESHVRKWHPEFRHHDVAHESIHCCTNCHRALPREERRPPGRLLKTCSVCHMVPEAPQKDLHKHFASNKCSDCHSVPNESKHQSKG